MMLSAARLAIFPCPKSNIGEGGLQTTGKRARRTLHIGPPTGPGFPLACRLPYPSHPEEEECHGPPDPAVPQAGLPEARPEPRPPVPRPPRPSGPGGPVPQGMTMELRQGTDWVVEDLSV